MLKILKAAKARRSSASADPEASLEATATGPTAGAGQAERAEKGINIKKRLLNMQKKVCQKFTASSTVGKNPQEPICRRCAKKNGYNVNRGAVSHTPSPTMARSAGQAKRPERSAFVGAGYPLHPVPRSGSKTSAG